MVTAQLMKLAASVVLICHWRPGRLGDRAALSSKDGSPSGRHGVDALTSRDGRQAGKQHCFIPGTSFIWVTSGRCQLLQGRIIFPQLILPSCDLTDLPSDMSPS